MKLLGCGLCNGQVVYYPVIELQRKSSLKETPRLKFLSTALVLIYVNHFGLLLVYGLHPYEYTYNHSWSL